MTELLYQGHGSYRLTSEHGAVVYIDPFAGEGYDKPADLVLVSHEHSDHNQVSRVHLKPDGKVLRAANLIDGASYGGCLAKDVLVKNHPKSECVGFLISTGGKKLYFACDTSETEEMKKLRAEQIDYAFLPIDGIYNMNAIEAARCAEIIGAKCNVPVHMKPGALFSQEMAESFHAENRLILRPGQTITW